MTQTVPHDDLVAHEPGEECVCGPVPIPVVTGAGDQFAIIKHRRLDRRELDIDFRTEEQ